MVITVTLNPAVDKTIEVNNFKPGALNRVNKVRKDPGGKGINVSRVVLNLGGKTLALGFLAGPSGQFIADDLQKRGIESKFTWLDGETRTNVKVVDPALNQETEINEPGVEVPADQSQQLIENLLTTADVKDYVVLTGSLPPGVSVDIYAEMITKLKSQGIKTVLDTSGPALDEGLTATPYLIKPNREELSNLVNQHLTEIDEIVAAAKKIHSQGINIVVVSLGKEGAVAISEQGIWRTRPPQVEAASTVGAGDTLLGALTLQLSQGQDLQQAITYATAASAGSVIKPGTQLCTAQEIEQLLPQVNTVELERGDKNSGNY